MNSEVSNASTTTRMIDGATALAAFIQVILCVGGILLYILVCWTMLNFRKTTFANSFYTLAVALAVPDCLHLTMELVCSIPTVLIGFENVPFTFVATCGFCTTFAYWWLAPLMIVIGVNRYVAVCHFQAYKTMFSQFRIKVLIACCFASAFILPTLMYGCSCRYLFKEEAWKYYCAGGCEQIAMMTNAVLSSAYTLAVAAIYTLIFIQYKLIQQRMGAAVHNHRFGSIGSTSGNDGNHRQSKKEAALMFQFGLISLVLILYIGIFWVVNLVWTNRYGDMFLNFFISLNSCISPILYLSFGSELRSRLRWGARVSPAVDLRAANCGTGASDSKGPSHQLNIRPISG